MIYDKLNMIYNNWEALLDIDDNSYICKCSCGAEEVHSKDELRYDKVRMCENCTRRSQVERQRKKYEGMQFGKWKVENFIGNRRYICLCTGCNTRYEMVPADFEKYESRNNKPKSCKKCSGLQLKDIKGQTFGDYYVIEYVGNHYWKCKCTRCGRIKNVTSQHLTLNNNTKCIDCSNKERGREILNNTINSLIGTQINNLKVINYNYNTNKYICECQCKDKNIIEVSRSNLKSGNVKSCGCLTLALKNKTMIERYGDVASKRIINPRDMNDIKSLEDKELFIKRYKELVDKIGRTPRSVDIAKEFDITTPIALKYAHKYEVDVDTDTSAESEYERQIQNIFTDLNIKLHVRNVIYPQELDIYIPDRHIAIEFNGSYWHSTERIDKYYHQNKTIACAKQGIQLIHIFEHEWNDKVKHKKLENILKNINNDNRKSIRASDLIIKNVDIEECKDFLDTNHLQNNTFSEIRIGLYKDTKLLSIMTFGKPRFNSNFEYELVRFCTDQEYKVYGAASKLFKYFINNYNPKSIITYCDITKFTGNTYTKLGFTCSQDDITEPNYCWVNTKLEVINRYQTQKHKLLENGLGTEEQTEDEIMKNLGYYKVYNSGNLKMSWFSD